MALAVTHVILVIVALDIFRHYLFGKGKFPRYLLVVGGIAGLFPDIDIPLSWFYGLITSSTVSLHGTFTHSLLFPLLFLAAAGFLHYQGKMKWAKIGYIVSFGWFFHLGLDCLYGGYKDFLWPFFVQNFCPQFNLYAYATSIDALILVFWLVHEELHQKIKDYF